MQMPMKIPLTVLLHYLIASLDGYVHFKTSACKIEFIVSPLFVLQLSENDYTAVCGYGLETWSGFTATAKLCTMTVH